MGKIHNWINTLLIFIAYVLIFLGLFYNKLMNISINWFSDNSVIENLYYIAGVLSLGTIFIAVVSFKTSKDEAHERKIREIAVTTIDLCNSYINDILPEMDRLTEILPQEIFALNLNNFDCKCINKCQDYIDKLNPDIYAQATKLLNKIEGISLFFEKGYYNKDIAKQILSEIYCEHIERLFPIILIERHKNKALFKDMIHFYDFLKNK
ncbi:DUF4760 domain-containing protein [Sedimentibacter saalensis]|uniref:DUF4760 domain-containing protein n=1 Tax=Sedimentibacter saalensis TaxID=130788 RepID=UPI0028970206|nr:hypothetical protein [Sedimentibacter saalensis]